MIIEEFRRFLKEHPIKPTITLEEFFNDDPEETEMYTAFGNGGCSERLTSDTG